MAGAFSRGKTEQKNLGSLTEDLESVRAHNKYKLFPLSRKVCFAATGMETLREAVSGSRWRISDGRVRGGGSAGGAVCRGEREGRIGRAREAS